MPSSIFKPLDSDRLSIDEFNYKDFQSLKEIAKRINAEAITQVGHGYKPFYAFWTDPTSPKYEVNVASKTFSFLKKAKKEQEIDPRSTHRMAVRLKDGTLVGNVCIDTLPIRDGNRIIHGDLGYFVDPKHAGKGYAFEAARCILTPYFSNHSHVDITAHPDNKISENLLLKLGARKIGYIPSSTYGQHEPRNVYIITKDDFRQALYNEKRKSHQDNTPCSLTPTLQNQI